MEEQRDDPEYKIFPELAPYTDTDRYGTPKEDFKTVVGKLEEILDVENSYRVADLGCANGELLYLIHQKYPHWNLYGYDYKEEFIQTAKNFDGLSDVYFEVKDIFEIEETFDVILSTLVLSGFQNIEKPLGLMLDICRDGGYILGTGLFNPFNIEVRVEYCDNTNPVTRGEWRTDYNRHAQQSIREFLEERGASVEFERCPFDVELSHDSENPFRVWTMKDEEGNSIKDQDGNYILINGARQILNQTLMTVQK